MKAWQKLSSPSAFLFKQHWPIMLLTFIAIIPLFADLGGDYLWADEGDTAVLAKSILKSGVPKAWDGTTFTDSDFGDRLNENLTMVSHPWLQYYVTAASFLIFGETPFAARLPFALAGLLSIPLLYALVARITLDRRAALSAAILLLLSVQFLLFSRQCRNYSLNMFLACVLMLLFFELKNVRGCILFSAVAILLFHCNPTGLAPLGALALLTLIHPPFAQYRRWFWSAMPLVAVFVLPWIFVAQSGYQQNTSFLKDWTRLAPRLVQFYIECASVTPLVGVIVLFLLVWVRKIRTLRTEQKLALNVDDGRRVARELFETGERNFLVIGGVTFISYSVLIALTQSRMEMWQCGLRHCTPLIPLGVGAVGLLASKVAQSSRHVWLAIMLILGCTKLGRITPWSFLHEERTFFDDSVFAAMHVPKGWAPKLFRVALVSFSRELWHENRGTVAHVCEFLKTNAEPEEVLITNYAWEPIYFHTGLPQGLKVMPHYPIFQAAQRHGLPDYVFSVAQARWLVWRWAWDGYRDFHYEQVMAALHQSGAVITKVAEVPETAWENRANKHFHRYPEQQYYYGFYENLRNAEIFRIDWPAANDPASQRNGEPTL